MTAVAAVPEKPGKVKAFLRLVAIEHSVFALPFAYLSALVAMDRLTAAGVHWLDLLLVTIAMVAGRTFAMAANRILDRQIDALNPRTAQPGTGHRRGERAYGLDRRGRRRWSCCFVAAGLLNPLCLVLVAARRGPAGGLPVREAVHQLPALRARAGPGGRPGRRLAGDHRHVRRLRARPGCSAWRSGSGSAASTSSTPARTWRSTGRSACTRRRPGSACAPRCTSPPSRTW